MHSNQEGNMRVHRMPLQINRFFLFCLFAVSLTSCDLLSPFPREVQIRVLNNSDYDFDNLMINGVEFGRVEKYAFSGYGSFETAYRYGSVFFEIDEQPFRLNPIDFSGETALDDGTYTYMLSVDVEVGEVFLTFFEGNEIPDDDLPEDAQRIIETSITLGAMQGIEVSTEGFILTATRTHTTLINPTVSEVPGSKVRYVNMARASRTEQEFLLIRTDEQGNIIWTKPLTLDAPGHRPLLIEEASDGSFFIAGNEDTSPTDTNRLLTNPFVLKTDASGNILWHRRYPSDLDTQVFDLVSNEDGGLVLAGYRNQTWFMQIDADGHEVWQTTLSRSYHGAESVLQTRDGYVATGGVNRTIPSSGLTKIDRAGNEIWTTSLNYNLESVIQASDQAFIVIGSTLDNQANVLVKYDTNGILQWRRELQDSERVFSLTERPNEGWAASGLTVDDQAGRILCLVYHQSRRGARRDPPAGYFTRQILKST